MFKKVLSAAVGIFALITSTGPVNACSTHLLIVSGDDSAGTSSFAFPVPITLTVQDSVKYPGFGIATVSTFQVAATLGDTCAVAISLSPDLVIESLAFVDGDDRNLAFSEFAPSKEHARTFYKGGGEPSFRVFIAEVDSDVPTTLARLKIWFHAKPRGLTTESLVDRFARSRIATGKVNRDSGFTHHLSVVRPAAVVGCLGLPDRDGLSTCPAHDHAH